MKPSIEKGLKKAYELEKEKIPTIEELQKEDKQFKKRAKELNSMLKPNK